MKSTIIFTALIIALGASSFARAEDSVTRKLYFDEQAFVADLTKSIQDHFTHEQIAERFQQIRKNQKALDKLLQQQSLPEWKIVRDRMRVLHSLSLVDFNLLPAQLNTYSVPLTPNMDPQVIYTTVLDLSLQKKLEQGRGAIRKLESEHGNFPQPAGQISKDYVIEKMRQKHVPEIYIQQFLAFSMADRLTEWMAAQKYHSISHSQLLQKATEELGEDPLTALGVIGTLFTWERIQLADRENTAVFNTRMKPLFGKNTRNIVGCNYHFWGYFNLALRGEGWLMKMLSYGYEGFYQNDKEELELDMLAIRMGTQLRQNLGE